MKLCSTDALDIVHIIDSRRQTTNKKSSLTRKPAIKSKSELNKKALFKKRRSKSDLDISSSSGDFESIASWINWRAQRNPKRTGIDRMPARNGYLSLPLPKGYADSRPLDDESEVQEKDFIEVNPSYSIQSTHAIHSSETKHPSDSEDSGYDYIKGN